MRTTSGRRSKLVVRKLIPARKMAAAAHIQVSIHNPERRIGVVDVSHKVCPCVDADSSLAAATD